MESSSSPSSAAESQSSGSSDSTSNRVILSAKYIEGQTNKQKLALRLRNVVQVLRDDESIETDSPDFPGLPSLCQALVPCVTHKDKQVRLYSVAACMELFGICAPDAPWTTSETLEIFQQTIRQLANFSHTTSPTQANFSYYLRILELLAHVKVGVLLVDLTKEEDDTGALPVLCDLFRTLLQSVRLEHPPEIAELAQLTIGGCLEEFYESLLLPVPLLDEILICIGQGPVVLVTNPQKAAQRKSKKKLPPHQVEQSNPSYLLASAIVRKAVHRLSTPIASLLNALLNNQERATAESCILTKPVSETLAKPQQQNQLSQADVWSIIYELHKIAPSILTTVIGNLSNFLSVPEIEQRRLVVTLLGRIFVKSSKLASHFRRCYRDWLERSNDVNVQIRTIMVEYLLQLVPSQQADISDEAQQNLARRLDDPSVEVRLKCIHGLCDVAYNHRTAISLPVWKLLGTRLSSKFKQERKDALTGLAQIYYRHYTANYLKNVEAGGDDCSLEVVQEALVSDDDGRYSWIPTQVFLCASWTDDADLRSRLWQVIDELLLGSEMPNSSKSWNPTARAVGLALLLDNLQPNAMAWLKQLHHERAKLQRTLGAYIDARSKIQSFPVGSEEALAANADAQDLLNKIAGLTSLHTTPGECHPTLEKFHSAKDKHIFRILSTIATPTHSGKARARALEELPKRLKLDWTKVLVRRCAMGDFLNLEVIHHSLLLAQECYNDGDLGGCKKFLVGVQIAVDTFPELFSRKETFELLVELFIECRSRKVESDLVTTLSSIISKAAPSQGNVEMNNKLKTVLLRLSCRDGTPEQARHAVSTMTSLMRESDAVESLLNSLTGPSRLTINTKVVSILAALTELAECEPQSIVSAHGQKAVGFAMEQVLLGKALSSDTGDDAEMSDSENTDMEKIKDNAETPTNKRRSQSKTRRKTAERKHSTPKTSDSFIEDESLSLSCRTICAAIEFLAAYIRSATLCSRRNADESVRRSMRPDVALIDSFFNTLCEIIRDGGIPPCSEHRKDCCMRQDRTAIRTSAALALLRLCDARLGLDQKYLSPARWHILSGVFLDDEKVCRDRVMLELGLMLTGNGKFGKSIIAGQAVIPSLRFFAFLVFCVDGEHGSIHCGANGNAANVGKRSQNTKTDATEGVTFRRKAYEETLAQARATGPDAEAEFEKKMKTVLMPEYVVPYALHLLSYRRETPSVVASSRASLDSTDAESTEDSGASHKVLRKRLKWLFDPLVLSLGDSARNISFLLRMVEMFGKYFQPTLRSETSSQHTDGEDESTEASKLQTVCSVAREVLLSYVKKDVNLSAYPGQIQVPGNLFQRRTVSKTKKSKTVRNSQPKLDRRKQIESAGSTSSMGEEDSHEASPSKTNDSMDVATPGEQSQSLSQQSGDGSVASRTRSSLGSSPCISTLRNRSKRTAGSDSHTARMSPAASSGEGHVHFSPDVSVKNYDKSLQPDSVSFDGLSPIRTKHSPVADQGLLLSSGEKTRGTTPPSIVRNTKFSSSMGFEGGPTVSESSVSGSSGAKSTNTSIQTGSGLEQTDSNLSSASVQAASLSSARKKRPSPKQDEKAAKRRKRSVPKQIKVVRKKLQSLSPTNQRLRSRRNRSGGDEESLDFMSVDKGAKASSKTTGKRNQRVPKTARDSRKSEGKENQRVATKPRAQRQKRN